ncbi:MAG: DUF3501 family protein [Acidimicrobiia bacterium]
MHKLTLDDINDLRAYEREREGFRARIIAMKKRRRVQLGELLTLTFENTDTMRFQVQEMARAERMLTDQQIQHEIDVYNDLIPNRSELVATLFVELTDDALLREWLPKLVGIEHAISFRLPDGPLVAGRPHDEERLTRDEITSTVHYLTFAFTPEQLESFGRGRTRIVVDHEHYRADVELTEEQTRELAADLAGD